MRQSLLLGFVTSLALLVGGCPANQESPTAVGGSPTPAPQASPTSPSPPKATPLNTPPSPTVESQLPVNGLITTLPPEEQLKRATKGRVDPFSLISDIKPIKTVVPDPEGTKNNQPAPIKTVPPTPPAPPTRKNQSTGGNRANSDRSRVIIRRNILQSPRPPQVPKTNRQIAIQPGTRLNTTPKNKPNTAIATNPKSPTTQVALPPTPPLPAPPKFVPDLPKLPEPTLAQGVEVTGVVEVGGVPQAILKAPNESSRYVRAGQRVSNGQVLVKRIEMNRGPAPVVILEQYGIEVARQVGEKPSTTPNQPAAPPALPSTQPPA